MKTLFTTFLFLAAIVAKGQDLYIKTFGNNKGNPVIFVHGGPGYNCANFEGTTAQKLADRGFFVIVYDRRGEGRSNDPNAQFTFKQTFDDLNSIYQKYGLSKSIIIGHSFGGMVATLFAKSNPQRVQSVILVSSPVSLQKSLKNIVERSRAIYQSRKDSANLAYISFIAKMDTASIAYITSCLMQAMQNGFYSPKNPTPEAKNISSTLRADTLLKKYASQTTSQAPVGFWKNEKYTTIDLTKDIEELKKNGIKIFGLYGKDDGLYSTKEITDLQNQLGLNNLKYLDNCSHNVFIDQQTQFIEAVTLWTNR